MAGIVFIGMETSGVLRRGFQSRGFETYSCDILPSEDGGAGHIVADVFECLQHMRTVGKWPSLAIFHPTCTYLTISAEWAYKDADFVRYPGVGYHQRVKPGTLTGAARRQARELAIADVMRIDALPIKHKAVENPIGVLSSRWRKPDQIIQPNWFGDDASKATCLWLTGLPLLMPTNYFPPRIVNGLPRWSNQTGNGQNKIGPGANRWKERSRTFPGPAAAIVSQWSRYVVES